MFNKLLPNGIFPRDCILYWDGGVADRINKTAFTLTSTAAGTRIHRATSLTFNGTTSLVDCGSQLAGVGNITLCAWANAAGFGEGNAGRIVDNGKFYVRYLNTNSVLQVTSDGATLISSANSAVATSTEQFWAITRTSAGVVNIYLNGVLTGSADQASGTPSVASATNLIIGNNAAAGATHNGTLSHVRIFSKILTTVQIGQLYNLEK